MEKEEFIKLFVENDKAYIEKKREHTNTLEEAEKSYKKRREELIGNFAKFKVGDVVNRITESYKKPRRYIVKAVFGEVNSERQYKRDAEGNIIWDSYETVYSARISYRLETANGFSPNGGWSVKEEELTIIKS